MTKNKYILFIFTLLFTSGISAQKEERDFIRKGNRAFNDSVFVDAEVNYRKALEVNPQSTVSMYNLGNALSQQQKFKDAMEQYMAAADIEKDKMKLAQIYHNAGVIFQASQDYAQAIEAYKKALRNNPKDDETRYNLALAQKLLKDQEQNQQNQDQQDQQDQEDQQKQEQEQNQDQNRDQNQDQDQQDSKPEENEMSKENAEQMLNSVMQDEKNVQEKVKKQQQVIQSGRLEKDW
ncbi:MAG: tetratricopeptide repeat protein [Mediterranea sp.]|jgi:tetratricopeptide (TPR) repeat protein|nr:tetratricopeptide repeat protein [Mediterranea sp.]